MGDVARFLPLTLSDFMSTLTFFPKARATAAVIGRKEGARCISAPPARPDLEPLPTVFWTFSGEVVLPKEDETALPDLSI